MNLIKNKKGASLSGWTEVALFSVLIILMLGLVIGSFNQDTGKSYDPTFGFTTNETVQAFSDYQDTFQTGIKEGEANTNAYTGISLSSTWAMIKAGVNVVWSFLIGTWIEKSVSLAHLPMELGLILRILYVLSLGFIIIKIIMKVRP